MWRSVGEVERDRGRLHAERGGDAQVRETTDLEDDSLAQRQHYCSSGSVGLMRVPTVLEQIMQPPWLGGAAICPRRPTRRLRRQCPLLGAVELLVAEDPAGPQDLELGDVVVR